MPDDFWNIGTEYCRNDCDCGNYRFCDVRVWRWNYGKPHQDSDHK